MWHCFVHFCYEMYAEVALPKPLEELHQPVLNFLKGSFGQKKPVHCRASGLAAKWCWLYYDETQGAVFCFCGIPMCLWLHFK